MTLSDNLETHLRRFPTAPFLFVGSGIARRYLGLEDWDGLLRRFALPTGRSYEFFRASAAGNLPAVASAIAEVFHPIWWEAESYSASRDAYAASAQTPESALKYEVARHVSSKRLANSAPEALRSELELLQRVVVDGIITTNWDLLLEELFPDFRPFVGQDELLFSAPQGIAEIYKIHGSALDPESLVLTAADYARSRERNSYLAAKLLTIFVEHPVVFLGYRLNDPNIREILLAIASCLTDRNIAQLQDRLIFVQRSSRAASRLGHSTIMAEAFSIPILTATVKDDFAPVYEALGRLHRKFPARLLRQLKEHVYELVKTDDPHERLYVEDIEVPGDLSQADVVLGVGMRRKLADRGYRPITRGDLVADVLDNTGELDAERVVEESLPRITAKYVPVFKYLREGGYLNDDGSLRRDPGSSRVRTAAMAKRDKFAPYASYRRHVPASITDTTSFSRLAAQPDLVLHYGGLIPESKLPLDGFHEFLVSNRSMVEVPAEKTNYYKLVCLYDFLRYRQVHSAAAGERGSADRTTAGSDDRGPRSSPPRRG